MDQIVISKYFRWTQLMANRIEIAAFRHSAEGAFSVPANYYHSWAIASNTRKVILYDLMVIVDIIFPFCNLKSGVSCRHDWMSCLGCQSMSGILKLD
jgi:hypothetical protein